MYQFTNALRWDGLTLHVSGFNMVVDLYYSWTHATEHMFDYIFRTRVRTHLSLRWKRKEPTLISLLLYHVMQYKAYQAKTDSPESGRDREVRSHLPWEVLYEYEGKSGLGERGAFSPQTWIIKEAPSKVFARLPSKFQAETWEREGEREQYPGQQNGCWSPNSSQCCRPWWPFQYTSGWSLKCWQRYYNQFVIHLFTY